MSNYNIKNRKQLSDSDIESFKNYDAVKNKLSTQKNAKWLKWGIGGSMLTVMAVLAVLYFTRKKQHTEQSIIKKDVTANNYNPNDNVNLRSTASFWDSIKVSNAQNGVKWLTASNTVVIIPENSLLDNSGKEITGDVTLKINEFYDGVDAALSGIKMTYDSAGYSYHFKTGGMFELRAYQSGEELILKSNTKIQVYMSSFVNKGDFNTYYFDDKNDNWIYKGKNKSATRSFIYNKEKNKQINKNQNKVYPIALDFDKNEFPELSEFENVLFYPKVVNKEKYQKLKSTTWEDIDLTKKNGEYLLTAYSRNEDLRMVVIPSTELEDKINSAKKIKVNTSRNNIKEIKFFEANQTNEQSVFKVSGIRFNAQLKLTPSMQDVVNSKVVRVFSIEQFGMWNCDKPKKLPQGILASNIIFIDTLNDTLNYNGNYYLTENDKQLMFTYFPGQPFQYNPKSENCVWFTHLKDKNVYLYYAKGKEFELLNNQAFVMKKKLINPNKVNNYEIKKLLGV